MVGREEFMDIHELWVRGKNVSQIARLTGRDRKTIRRLLAVGQQPRKPREVASKLDPFREYLLARMLSKEDPVSNAAGRRELTPQGQEAGGHLHSAAGNVR